MKTCLSGSVSVNNFSLSLTASAKSPPVKSRGIGLHYRFTILITILITILMLWSSQAYSIAINQYSAFINSSSLGAVSLEDTQIGFGFNDFSGSGLDVTFTNLLDSNDLGTVSWEVTNDSGSDLSNVSFFGFLDAEIDEAINSFFNESGALVSVTGTGATDSAADFWEIDEPGFLFGDIYDNLLAGSLDNSNNVPAGLEDDVSLGLGFDIGTLLSGQSLLATFSISLDNIGGLSHTDPDSSSTFFFNGSAVVQDLTVISEPGSLSMYILGLACLMIRRAALLCLNGFPRRET